ncbi:SAF domain-containing protein [Luteipulveratus flavus]|uniref:SAF domain-containing protein n=1 Tax=Luteipulveratus flavus TaxID=3031728 RepID=A0ABT6C4E1_9MICO|nr:SAF domain-containing protein [Luteipulveratus sp. YIM 133296]MDF8263605.1 SAF domain-containing protein [Luteipulveratus sp. YIM 133296]
MTARRGRWSVRFEPLLPAGWRGHSREAAWRRSRARRVGAGVLAATAAVGVVGAVRPPAEPTHAVVVAARDVPAGARLTSADLRTVRWPSSARMPAAVPARELVGQALVTPVRAGEPVTATRLRSVATLPRLADGQVVVSVSQSDPTLARTVRVGDAVDAWAAEGGQQIGLRLKVVGVVGAGARSGESVGSGWGAGRADDDQPPALLLAVRRDVAGRLARAQAGSQSPGTAVLLAISPVT